MLTLLTFIGKDNYNKLGTAFTTLLMMAVYADQVKSSTPEHVQYMTWIDSFILSNLIVNVIATVSSCLMILFEEREWEHLHLALGNATCYTQIPFAVVLNLCLTAIGFTEGAKEVADLKETSLLLVGLSLNLASILALLICMLYLYRSYRNQPLACEEVPQEAQRTQSDLMFQTSNDTILGAKDDKQEQASSSDQPPAERVLDVPGRRGHVKHNRVALL